MPLLLLGMFIANLLSIGLFFVDYYLWREWYEYRNLAGYDDYSQRCLIGAISILVFSLLGKFPLTLLLSKKSRPDEPKPISGTSDKLIRPDGTEIHLEYFGQKGAPEIIFVHGWGQNSTEWYYQVKHFQSTFRIIAYDLAGLGKSTQPKDRNFSLEKLAHDLNAVITHTGAKNPILWGHSIGGMTILTLIAKFSSTITQPVRALILEHTTFTDPIQTMALSPFLKIIRFPIIIPLCFLMIVLAPLFWLMNWISFINGNAQFMTRILSYTGTQSVKQLNYSAYLSTIAWPAVVARGVLAMFKYDVTKELAAISLPALIIAANKDHLTQPIASEYINKNISTSQLVVVKPGGHQGLFERYEEVNEAAKQFIANLPERTIGIKEIETTINRATR